MRERLLAGDTDAEVKAFLVVRYGDYVLLEPPVKKQTWVLWFGPIAIVGIGGIAVWRVLRRGKRRYVAAGGEGEDVGPDDLWPDDERGRP